MSDHGIKTPLVEADRLEDPVVPIEKLERISATDVQLARSEEGIEISWVPDLADEYDFCIVFPTTKQGDFDKSGEGYCRKLKRLGFEMFGYKSVDGTKIFLLLRTPMNKMRMFADQIDFVMKLDEHKLKVLMETGQPDKGIAPIFINDGEGITPYKPYEYTYGKYSQQVDEQLYWRPKGMDHPFRPLMKLKLNALILSGRIPGGGESLKIRRYIKNKKLLACFPMHNRVQTSALNAKWANFGLNTLDLPLDEFKEYFGEKVTLYFRFMQHYTSFLLIPAVVGIPLQIAVFALDNYNAAFLPFYAFFVSLWSVTMLEFWKRTEKNQALFWGTIGFEESEQDKADFRGELITSFIDGSEIKYFPSPKRSQYVCQSFLAIAVLICLVTGVVVSIYVIRYAIQEQVGHDNAQTLASIMNAVQIQILNFIYSKIATVLTNRENHRTETIYEDSMMVKIFLFQFVNSYASFIYLAFIAEYMGDCPQSGCMPSLAINLGIIFFSRLASGNVMELALPYISFQYKYRSLKKSENFEKMSRPEKEFMLDPYDPLVSSLEDYAEVAIQFGYTALFVTALPMAAFFGFVSNIVEIKGDGWKLLNLHQRPFPISAEDIGNWQSIFLLISVAAVMSNAGLTVWTMSTFNSKSKIFRFWVFIIFQWACFILQQAIMAIIPDIPEEIEIQEKRQEFIVGKAIDQISDDIDEEVKTNQDAVVIKEYRVGGGYFEGQGLSLVGNMK